MESHWDLESVLEQCCSKLSNEDLLPPFTSAGDFSWLDEKADLSAWTELDLPHELTTGMAEAEPLSAHGSPFYEPKLQSQLLPSPTASQSPNWPSDPLSPTFPSPPLSPLNSFPFSAPARSQLEELQLSLDDMCYDRFAATCSSLPSSPVAPPANCSPPQTPASALPTPDVSRRSPTLGSSCTSPTVFLYEPVSSPCTSPQPDVRQSPQRAASPYDSMDVSLAHTVSVSTVCQQPIYLAPVEKIIVEPQLYDQSVAERTPEAAMEMEVVVEDNAGVEEYTVLTNAADETEEVPQAEVTAVAEAKVPAKTSKRKKRGGRKIARESVRKERKRLQNKDAATRYRQRKKQLTEDASQQYTEQYEENCKLKAEVQRISNEISYLKGLMRELAKAKGLLK